MILLKSFVKLLSGGQNRVVIEEPVRPRSYDRAMQRAQIEGEREEREIGEMDKHTENTVISLLTGEENKEMLNLNTGSSD